MAYDHVAIEKKWQERWKQDDTYRTVEDPQKKKKYVLDMFPYPSGEGLHVGHPKGYIATDIYSRHMRMRGFSVLHPMGWDAFGLPAENYALKHKTHPRKAVEQNIATFKEQLAGIGFDYDWSREINTTDPSYYHWTQWVFLKMLEHGLAYQSNEPINWCPSCMTGLANEDLDGAVCERCGTPVVKKNLPQWVLKITDYADRMLADLDHLNWPEHIKEAQRNWIGRSEGAELDFAVERRSVSEVVFASNNDGKLRRMQMLVKAAGLPLVLKTPKDVGVDDFDVTEDGSTLSENSEKKARTLAGLTGLPVLADDSGFFIDGEEIDPVTVKRNALDGADEKTLSVEDISRRMQAYYADIAAKRGGAVDAEWRNNLCLVSPDGSVRHEETIRPVTLTSESHGTVDPHLPLRGLYISKATGKYVLEQTEQEELIELSPITGGLHALFRTPSSESIRVFTTRPDTLYGATYLVLAPEHALVEKLIAAGSVTNADAVRAYVKAAETKTEIERGAEGKEKTGVKLEGVTATNPATKEEIPVYVADYVLGSYGTGAIMAVPAHDERDFQFAQKMGLPIRQVVVQQYIQTTEPGAYKPEESIFEKQGIIAVIKHWKEDKYLGLKWKKVAWGTFLTGGVDEGMTPEETVLKEIKEETGFVHATVLKKLGLVDGLFYHVPKEKNQLVHAHVFSVELSDGETVAVDPEEAEKHDLVWLTRDELKAFLTPETHQYSLRLLQNGFTPNTGAGSLINSGEFTGKNSERAKWEITDAAGGKRVTRYKLRDWVFSRQRYWGEPIPVIHCEKDGAVPVPYEDLPVLLPEVESYEPTGTGESPLAAISDWVNTTCPKCGGPAKRETNTMPQWAGSSWYYLRFMDPQNNEQLVSAKQEKYWAPVDVYVGGDHAVRHLIYARFWHKFLYDISVASTPEPFARLEFLGFILAEDGRKMSKRFGNVINPTDVVTEYGADAFRTYEMFMGPFENTTAWSTASIAGTARFIDRLWRAEELVTDTPVPALNRPLHETIRKIGNDIEAFKFNTAVSQMMIFLNAVENEGAIQKEQWLAYLRLLAPFAPHITEELWERAGETGSIHLAPWPVYDESVLAADTCEVTVQVNGKRRGSVTLAIDASEADAVTAARTLPPVTAALGGNEPKRVIYVPGKILNFVV